MFNRARQKNDIVYYFFQCCSRAQRRNVSCAMQRSFAAFRELISPFSQCAFSRKKLSANRQRPHAGSHLLLWRSVFLYRQYSSRIATRSTPPYGHLVCAITADILHLPAPPTNPVRTIAGIIPCKPGRRTAPTIYPMAWKFDPIKSPLTNRP